MSAKKKEEGIPSPWGQAYPRSVLLPPEGLLVPSGTLRALLRKSGRIEVMVRGFALAPFLGDGARVTVNSRRRPRPGDLVLCEVEGWGDIRRLVAPAKGGGWVTGLDAAPEARESLPGERVVAVVERKALTEWTGRMVAAGYPLWSRTAGLLYWIRKALEAPAFGADAAASVRRKYAGQVVEYTGMLGFPLGEELRALLGRTIPPGGSVVVAGSGAGGELIHLARLGYRVSGFDVLSEMVRAAEANCRDAGAEIEIFQADMAELDRGGRRFDGIYVTPLVYSFVPERARRVQSLNRLGRHLAPGGSIVYSVHLTTAFPQFLQAGLAWGRHALRGQGVEFGDWFTWFLRPDGSIGKSYSHLFTSKGVVSEAREAGFQSCRREGAYFVAGNFAEPESIAVQKSSSLRTWR